MSLKDYNLAHCIVLVDGIRVEGYNDGDAVEVEYESEVWTDVVGSDGEVTRSATNDRRATITFHLSETSSLNRFFRNKVMAGRTLGIGDTFSVMIKDIHNGETVISPQTWVKTDPGVSKGREAGDRDWACMGADVRITQL